MGTKGQSSTNTNQSQSYTPNPQAAGYIDSALGRAQTTAQLPFSVPQAPVAGFSPDQQAAFGRVNSAQGMAQPYINQANQYFGQSAQGPNISQFFNPYASAVMGNLSDIFGQQQQQTTGQLTQAAGGVGADRIAVGQSELAKQQGLTAGQTLANLYAPSLSAGLQEQNVLQGAGYGTATLGPMAQNAALSGANAQLGTGGLQQQLTQAQLNAPYQQQVAQAAFPYQQSQFFSGAVGALAPGLGGTTSGYGTSNNTPPQPSPFSQILGAGTAAAGIYGGFNGGSSGGKGGNTGTGDGSWYGPSSVGGAPLSGYARGGHIDLPRREDGSYGFDDGGSVESNPYQLPPNFNDKPINIDAQSIIPAGQTPAIRPQIPSLNLNPPAQSASSGSGSPSAGDAIKMGMQMAMMFANRGGKVDPKKFDGADPHGFADGGDTDDAPASFDERFPYRLAGTEAVDAWRNENPMAFAEDNGTAVSPAAAAVTRAAGPRRTASASQDVSPYSPPAVASQEGRPARDTGFAGSPWAALTAAGLGMMAGTSPFAGVNIGAGGMQGLKTLESQRAASQKDETIDQAAKRLQQEADFHKDQYSKMTPYQKATVDIKRDENSQDKSKPVAVGHDLLGNSILGIKDKDGNYIDPITRQPVKAPDAIAPRFSIPGATGTDEGALPPHAQVTQGVDVPEGVNPTVLAAVPEGVANKLRAVDEGRMTIAQAVSFKDKAKFTELLLQYDPRYEGTLARLRASTQDDLKPNGNSGKMILAVNQLLPHLKTASDKAQDLQNSNYPAANTIKNWWATATGDPAVRKFNTVKEVAAMDAARLLRGSGQMAEQDINFWRENIATSGSPAQLQETLKLLADDLMGARITSIQHTYRTNMRMEPPDFVSKEAKEALAAIKSRNGGEKPVAAVAPAPAAPAGSKPDAATRFGQLTAGGMSKADAYTKLHEEGY